MEKKRIDASMERLKSLKYHPLRYIEMEREISDSHVHKKLKTSGECKHFFFLNLSYLCIA